MFLELTEQITERLQAGDGRCRRLRQSLSAMGRRDSQAAADHATISSTMAGPSTATAGVDDTGSIPTMPSITNPE